MKFQLENGGKRFRSLFKNWKNSNQKMEEKWIQIIIGKKVQLQNGNNSKWKMKNINKSPITNGNENPIRKWK